MNDKVDVNMEKKSWMWGVYTKIIPVVVGGLGAVANNYLLRIPGLPCARKYARLDLQKYSMMF